VSRSFELFQLASVRTFQQPVRTTLNVRPSFRFSFQNQIWEDCCNRPDEVDSHPDALLLKASLRFKFNRPDANLPWSGRAYDRYGNCVQQITCLDGHPAWSGRVKPLQGNYLQRTYDRQDDRSLPSRRGSQTGKIFSEIFRISVAQLFVRTAYDHCPDGL
jgi:hypothetical protein